MRLLRLFAGLGLLLASSGARYGLERPEGGLYVVLLDSPSAVELGAFPRGGTLSPAAAGQAEAAAAALQQSLIGSLRADGVLEGVRIRAAFSFLMSRLLVSGSREALDKLDRHPRVRGVYPNRPRRPHLDAIPGTVHAEPVWGVLGGAENAGKGIRIGVIDSGIAVSHPMFEDSGFTPPEGFPLGELSETNAKVIVARSYVCPEYGYTVRACQSATDIGGHGTAVASVAAGRAVEAPLAAIQGLAPAAYLGNYNVFGSLPVANSAAIVSAIEDAVRDGMQVINLSLGGPEDDGTPAEHAAIEAARDSGVLVVASGGNGGPDLQTVDSPGDSDAALSVGAAPGRVSSISEFSARGPGSGSTLKPDLAAPGEDIYAGDLPNRYSRWSGTSFAAPIVSGAAALLRQLHPEWGLEAVKSALVNYAAPLLAGPAPARVFDAGAGLLDLERAAAPAVALDPVSLNFGLIEDSDTAGVERQVRLISLSESPLALEVEFHEEVLRGSVELIPSWTETVLDPGEEQTLTIAARLSDPIVSGAFEGRLLVLADGEILVSMVYWGGVSMPSSELLTVSQTGAGEFTSLREAVAAANPGNTVEITDSGVYRETVRIGLNRDAVPQSGLTIRAGPGSQPRLEAPPGPSVPLIRVQDLADVNIEGLHLVGGKSSVELLRSSAVIRGNLIEESQHTSGSHGISLTNSGAHILENTIRWNGRDGVFALDSTVLVQGNRILENSANGFFSEGSIAALFDNQLTGNTSNIDAQNARFQWSLGLMKGSLVTGAAGPLGDGVLVSDAVSELTLDRNRIEGNRLAGVRVRNGASVQMTGDAVMGNGAAGVILENDGRFEGHSVRISGNQGGLVVGGGLASLSDSLLDRSTGGPGVVGTQPCELDLWNVTVAGNPNGGVDAAPCVGGVKDSILAGNAGFDVLDPGNLQFENNLIGDGTLDGVLGNFAADPRFADASAGDFRLLPGSPAIDRGSDSGWSDLFFHHRPVDGDGDAVPRPDLGAFESGSDHVIPVSLPALSPRPDHFLGIAWLNQSRETAGLRFRQYGPDGRLLGEGPAELDPLNQRARLREEWLPGSADGWLQIAPETPLLQGVSLFGPYSLESLDGGRLEPGYSDEFVLTEFCSGDPGSDLYLTNRLGETVAVRLTWVLSDSEAGTLSASVPPQGLLRMSAADIRPDWTGMCGFLRVEQLQPSGRPGLSVSNVLLGPGRSALLAGLPVDGPSDRLVAPQVASGGGIETWIHLVSPGFESEARVELFDGEGNTVASRSVRLALDGQWRRSVSELLPMLQLPFVGWAAVSVESGQIVGSVRFEGPEESYLTVLPLQREGAREFVLAQLAETEELFTGVGLLNDGPYWALLTVEAFKPEGERLGIRFLELAPGARLARTAGELFESLGEISGGYLRVRATTPVSGFGIFAARDLRFYSAVSPQILAR